MKKILILIFLTLTLLYGDKDFIIKNEKSENVTLSKGDFKILQYDKRITNILASDSSKLEVIFLKDDENPLQTIKLYGKDIGFVKLLLTFSDNTTVATKVNIVSNISKLVDVIQIMDPEVIIEQAHGKVILTGYAKDTNEKTKIESLLQKGGIDTEKDLINLLEVRKPNKMIRIKLYVTEINNNDGLDIKNNWTVGYKNYVKSGVQVAGSQSYIDGLNGAVEGAVTLTGGLTAGANILGDRFNTGMTLNYLSSKGIATILDETELITLENKKATFHAGGNIYVKTQTTTSQGVPSTELKQIDYGLKLEAQVNSIINNEYVSLTITTKQDKIDWANAVDGIPGFNTQSIDTNVIIKDKATIILGGLVNQNDAKNYLKIPFLGDIPILGALFRSKSFQSGKSELVFFIVPEIVDPSTSGEVDKLTSTKENIAKVNGTYIEPSKKMAKELESQSLEEEVKKNDDENIQDTNSTNKKMN
jgi:pilus assembly protein CpaC